MCTSGKEHITYAGYSNIELSGMVWPHFFTHQFATGYGARMCARSQLAQVTVGNRQSQQMNDGDLCLC